MTRHFFLFTFASKSSTECASALIHVMFSLYPTLSALPPRPLTMQLPLLLPPLPPEQLLFPTEQLPRPRAQLPRIMVGVRPLLLLLPAQWSVLSDSTDLPDSKHQSINQSISQSYFQIITIILYLIINIITYLFGSM